MWNRLASTCFELPSMSSASSVRIRTPLRPLRRSASTSGPNSSSHSKPAHRVEADAERAHGLTLTRDRKSDAVPVDRLVDFGSQVSTVRVHAAHELARRR